MSAELGQRLRQLRTSQGYSLAQAARGSDISKSFLALLESGKTDITITRLMRLTRFYGVHIADVLPDGASDELIVVRDGKGRHIQSPEEGIDVLLLSRQQDRTISPILASFDPHGQSEPSAHDGEEFVYVLTGRFELIFPDNTVTLERGDSAHFKSDQVHTYRNLTDAEARLLSITTPPIF